MDMDKLLPIMVRYCKANDGSMSTETKLNLGELKREKAEKLAADFLVMTEKFSLEKAAAFSTNNTNTNCGKLNRVGRVNVHIQVKNALQQEETGLGRPVHIIHSATKTAMDTCPIDVEHQLTKIFFFLAMCPAVERGLKCTHH